MSDETKSPSQDQQPVSGAKDERVHAGDARNKWKGGKSAYPGGGVNGPVEKDRQDYKTHYGETAYGGGQGRYGGQPAVTDEEIATNEDRSIVDRPEGKAGSKATLPGAGADEGPAGKR